MKYRLYPSKDTTIIENTQFNSGQNEVMELWYGLNGVTRHLVKFDMSYWIKKIQDNIVPEDISNVDCTLKMFNCYPTYEEENVVSADIATGVDVEVTDLTSSWDEGSGFDIVATGGDIGVANWYSATTLTPWTSSGGDYSGTSHFTQHLDYGYENITGDVSTAVASWCGGTNNGLMVKYSDATEALTGTVRYLTKFYTKDTHTIFLPFVEFEWDGDITDQRAEVGYGLTKKLYLFTHKNGSLTNVDDISGVTINYSHPDLSGSPTTISSGSVVNQYPGVYYVEVTFPSYPGSSGDTTFTDTWNIDYEGSGLYSTISMSGSLDSYLDNWNVNDGTAEKIYDLSLPHLKEEYKMDEIVFLDVDVYERYTSTKHILRDLEYKIDLIDGENRFSMVDWQTVSYTPIGNTIILDFSWFIRDCTYEINFRKNSYGDEELYGDLTRTFIVRYEEILGSDTTPPAIPVGFNITNVSDGYTT